jgi:hypothetical protein
MWRRPRPATRKSRSYGIRSCRRAVAPGSRLSFRGRPLGQTPESSVFSAIYEIQLVARMSEAKSGSSGYWLPVFCCGSDQHGHQCNEHGAAEQHGPVAQIETKKPALGPRNCELRHDRPLNSESTLLPLDWGRREKVHCPGAVADITRTRTSRSRHPSPPDPCRSIRN